MLSTLFLCTLGLLPGVLPESGTQLTYRGSFVPDKGDPIDAVKKFELTVLVANVSPTGASLYWTLSEEHRGSWTWADHFGRLDVDDTGKANDGLLPALLYVRNDEGTSIVPITSPLLGRKLEAGTSWEEGRISSRVAGEEKLGQRPVWRVEVTTPFGRKRTQFVDKSQPFVVALSERVFVGQGEQHELKYELQSTSQFAAVDVTKVVAGFDALAKLRDQLGHKPRNENVVWSDDQLAMLKRELPAVLPLAVPPLTAVAMRADQDSKDQKGRAASVAQFRKKSLGSQLPEFKLEGLNGSPFTHEELKGNVTVLHFWEYRDHPLQEPYGQVGYLDFLFRQKLAANVKVLGVAVDDAINHPNTRGKVLSSVKKLRAFMNLGYPIVLDDGSLLRKLGDPRVAGAKLPLFLVVGKDGRVVEYHVGAMEVDRDRGLKGLEETIKTALGK